MEFTNLHMADYPAMLSLYNASFPEAERRLYGSAEQLSDFIISKGGKFRAFAAKEGGIFIGFLSYWVFENFMYVEHFAVDEKFRGKGTGSKMLSHLFSKIGGNVLIEVEHPTTEEAARRIKFYERNGFRVRREFDYLQPPYGPGQEEVPLLLMTHGNVTLENLDSIREMLREVYNVNH